MTLKGIHRNRNNTLTNIKQYTAQAKTSKIDWNDGILD